MKPSFTCLIFDVTTRQLQDRSDLCSCRDDSPVVSMFTIHASWTQLHSLKIISRAWQKQSRHKGRQCGFTHPFSRHNFCLQLKQTLVTSPILHSGAALFFFFGSFFYLKFCFVWNTIHLKWSILDWHRYSSYNKAMISFWSTRHDPKKDFYFVQVHSIPRLWIGKPLKQHLTTGLADMVRVSYGGRPQLAVATLNQKKTTRGTLA